MNIIRIVIQRYPLTDIRTFSVPPDRLTRLVKDAIFHRRGIGKVCTLVLL